MFTKDEVQQAIYAERRLQRMGERLHVGKLNFLTEDTTVVVYFANLVDLAKKIGYRNVRLSELARTRYGTRRARLTRWGQRLVASCRQYDDLCRSWDGEEMRFRFDRHRFHPTLGVMLQAVDRYHRDLGRAVDAGNQDAVHETLTKVSEMVRARFASDEFRTEVRNYSRNSEQKFRRALDYLLSLFRSHSRLLILRVDLYVREEHKEWSYTADADDAFDKLVRDLQANKIVPNVLGWMSAREDGMVRGQHYHVLVALDGHKHRAGAILSKLIGEYWVKECVGSEYVGSYYNCFALEDHYVHLGIGQVHFSDAKKLLGLFYATKYLCKDEVQLIATGKRQRNFRRGVQVKEARRMGAPRKGSDNVDLARRVFFGQLADVKAKGEFGFRRG